MTPEDLVAGPRGRRLLLALAEPGATQEARDALFDASSRRDPYSVTVWFRGEPGSTRIDGPTQDPGPSHDPTLRDVNDLLLASPLPAITLPRLLSALSTSTDATMPWQEPDGTDALAADPAMRRALDRLAHHVASSVPSWWSGGAREAGTQVEIRWDDVPVMFDLDREGIVSELSTWRYDAVRWEAEQREQRRAHPFVRPSGIWLSTPPRTLAWTSRHLPGLWPLGLSLQEDDHGWQSAEVTEVTTPAEARVLVVDGPEDWAALCRTAALDVTATSGDDWERSTGTEERSLGRREDEQLWVRPDWSHVAEHADAVHVSIRGYLTTAGRAIDLGDGRASVLAGWAPDATVWFVPQVERAGSLRTYARDDDGRWHPAA